VDGVRLVRYEHWSFIALPKKGFLDSLYHVSGLFSESAGSRGLVKAKKRMGLWETLDSCACFLHG
jgi:hypothetical protein